MKNALLLITATLMLLAACAGFEQPPANSDFGRFPTNVRDPIIARMATVLKDPQSATYRFSVPQRGYLNNGLAYGGKIIWQGYIVDFYVNAKNSFGGYTGEQRWYALLRDGVVTEVDTADQEGFRLHRL